MMNEANQRYLEIGRSIPNAVESQLFGKPCFKINGKAFMSLFENCAVFKLSGEFHREALALDGTSLFDPSKKNRPMKEWIQIPIEYEDLWTQFALEAHRYVGGN